MKPNVIKTTLYALCLTFLFGLNLSYACITPNVIIKFSDAKEFAQKLPQYIEVKSEQFVIIETPDEGTKAIWTAFVDYASSPNAGNPKKPKLEITFFDKSKKETKDSNMVRYIQISATRDGDKADAIIGFLHQSQEKNEILDTVVTRVKVIQREPHSSDQLKPKCA